MLRLAAISALSLIGLMALPGATAQAIQEATPEPGLRYQVVDVAPDDRLNVRAQAGVGAGRVGSLAPDARGVVVTGLRIQVDGSVWWQVAHGPAERGVGWVNARFLAPEDPHGPHERDYPLSCGGTEPFWSVSVADGQARYSSPEGEVAPWQASAWIEARARPGHFAVRLEANGGVGYAAVMRDYNFCYDGMSDFQYPFHGLVIRPDGEVLAGCCHRLAR